MNYVYVLAKSNFFFIYNFIYFLWRAWFIKEVKNLKEVPEQGEKFFSKRGEKYNPNSEGYVIYLNLVKVQKYM